MIRMQCVLCQEGTEVVLMIQMNFISQRATFGCKIVSSLKKKGDKNIWNSGREKSGSNPARRKILFSFSKPAEQVWGQTSLLFNGYPGSFLG